jgi:hypothetical protein
MRHLAMALEPPELAFGFEESCCAPASAHVAVVASSLDVAADGPADRDHRLDHVRAHQAACQRAVDAEVSDGEHVLESLAQRPGGVGVGLVELGGQPAGLAQTGVRIGVSERAPQPGVDTFPFPGGQVVGDVAALVDLTTGEMTPDDAEPAPPGGGPPPLYFNNSRDNLVGVESTHVRHSGGDPATVTASAPG